MKPKEFYEIMERFVEEEKRWKALKVGELVYEEDFRDPISPDFFEHEIVSIDVDNRELTTKDHSEGGKIKKMCGFYTIKELEKRGIKLEKS
jgi:hypothetical protein